MVACKSRLPGDCSLLWGGTREEVERSRREAQEAAVRVAAHCEREKEAAARCCNAEKELERWHALAAACIVWHNAWQLCGCGSLLLGPALSFVPQVDSTVKNG
jgi:hypothetical protein